MVLSMLFPMRVNGQFCLYRPIRKILQLPYPVFFCGGGKFLVQKDIPSTCSPSKVTEPGMEKKYLGLLKEKKKYIMEKWQC